MTPAANACLEDCRQALRFLEDEEDPRRRRLLWVAAISLLRAVGSVVEKVDAHDDPWLRRSVKSAFSAHKANIDQHKVYWEFIKRSRDFVLKEYDFEIEERPEVTLTISTDEGSQASDIGTDIYWPHYGEYRHGDDARDILQEGIEWWERELTRIRGGHYCPTSCPGQ